MTKASSGLVASPSRPITPGASPWVPPSPGGDPTNSPLNPQGGSHRPSNQSAAVPTAQNVAHNSTNHYSSSSALSAGASGWAGLTSMLRPGRARPQGSGALLDHPDPVLSSIAESDGEAGGLGTSAHANTSTDLDAVNAASSANKLWAVPNLRHRGGGPPSQGSSTDRQTGPTHSTYIAPSPWSAAAEPSQSATGPPYPVPTPGNQSLARNRSLGRNQSPGASVGPFEAAARARALQKFQSRSGSGASSSRSNPSQAAYPVPPPGHVTPDTPQSAFGGSSSNRLMNPVPSPNNEWGPHA